jgi:hypothetical protein
VSRIGITARVNFRLDLRPGTRKADILLWFLGMEMSGWSGRGKFKFAIGVAASVTIVAIPWFGICKYRKSAKQVVYQGLCSNHVIDWIKKYNDPMKAHLNFGPRHDQMMAEFKALIYEYIDTGHDRLREVQVDWVTSFVPGYMQACEAHHLEMSDKCHSLPREDFEDCLKAADSAYQEMIDALFQQAMVDGRPWDLSDTDLAEMRRAHRRLADGELALPDTAGPAAAKKSDETIGETGGKEAAGKWGPLLEVTRNLKKQLKQNPQLLGAARPEHIEAIAVTIDHFLNSLPSDLQEIKPQLEHFRTSIRARRTDLVVQYCDYFDSMYQRKAASASAQ